jgi:hypothetical protein
MRVHMLLELAYCWLYSQMLDCLLMVLGETEHCGMVFAILRPIVIYVLLGDLEVGFGLMLLKLR